MINEYLHFKFKGNKDSSIWRYFSFEKFESLLKNKALYFSRSDLLGDDHEGSYPTQNIKLRPKFYEGATKHFIEEGLSEMGKNWGLFTHVSCWHSNDSESAAMWKLFSNEQKSISIKTNISNLMEAIIDKQRSFIFSYVNYIDYDIDRIPEFNQFVPYLHKRKEFSHEREFRIITDNLSEINKLKYGNDKLPTGLYIDVDLEKLINLIVISPFSDSSFKNKVTELLEQYGLKEKLIKSSLIRQPTF